MIQIGPAMPADRPRIAEQFFLAFARQLRPILGADAARIIAPSLNLPRIYVARDGSRPVGFAGLRQRGEGMFTPNLSHFTNHYGPIAGRLRFALLDALPFLPDPGACVLDGIYVDPAMRGAGVAAQLLARVEEDAEGDRIMAQVISANRPALRFYEKQGFGVSRHSWHPLRGAPFGMARLTLVAKLNQISR